MAHVRKDRYVYSILWNNFIAHFLEISVVSLLAKLFTLSESRSFLFQTWIHAYSNFNKRTSKSWSSVQLGNWYTFRHFSHALSIEIPLHFTWLQYLTTKTKETNFWLFEKVSLWILILEEFDNKTIWSKVYQ